MTRLEAAVVLGSIAIASAIVLTCRTKPAPPTVPACQPVEVRVVYDSRMERESDLDLP